MSGHIPDNPVMCVLLNLSLGLKSLNKMFNFNMELISKYESLDSHAPKQKPEFKGYQMTDPKEACSRGVIRVSTPAGLDPGKLPSTWCNREAQSGVSMSQTLTCLTTQSTIYCQ